MKNNSTAPQRKNNSMVEGMLIGTNIGMAIGVGFGSALNKKNNSHK